ncbi:MAG: DUF445 family protein [Bacteroidales bacterium]|nr:DUF445 family protein [Bacteroidales bacterium]
MPPFVTFMVGPVVGALIGGLTNRVAIRMLFRPYTAKYIGPIRLPLTPGIIPKERENISKAIGSTISDNLLNSQVLSATLLSDQMYAKLTAAVDSLQARMMANQESLQQLLLHYLSPDELSSLSLQLQSDITHALYLKLADKALGDRVAALAIDQVMQHLADSLLGSVKVALFDLLRSSIQSRLADIINEMMRDNAEHLLADLLHTEADRLLAMPVCNLCRDREALFDQLRTILLKAYRTVVENSLPRMLATLNIQQIVEQRINAMDMAETEHLITSIMNRELKALVWFGVLLGFLLGFVTNIL